MNAIANIMSKLSGVELGKLFLKDTVSIMQGQGGIYSREDFQTAINRLGTDRYEFNNYRAFREKLVIHGLLYQSARDTIDRYTISLTAFKVIIIDINVLVAIRQSLTFERLERGEVEPGETESAIRDRVINLMEFLIDCKDRISQIYAFIDAWLKLYFTCVDILKGISRRLELPELENVVSDDILSQIAELNTWAAELPEEYKGIFQQVDIENQAMTIDTNERVNLLMSYIKN